MTDRFTDESGEPMSQDQVLARLQEMGPSVQSNTEVEMPELDLGTDQPVVETSSGEEPSDAGMEASMRKECDLPDEKTQAVLKEKYQRFGELTVVPLLTKNANGKMTCVIIRPLNRSEWRSAQEIAMKKEAAAGGAGKSGQEYFEERIAELSIVWPAINPATFDGKRAGFIPTIYGVVERASWFFDVPSLLNITYTL